MHDTDNFSFQRKCQKLLLQRFQIIFLLRGRDKMYKDLTGCHTTAQHQMSEIACVLQFSVISSSFFSEKLTYTGQNIGHILMHQFTVIRI